MAFRLVVSTLTLGLIGIAAAVPAPKAADSEIATTVDAAALGEKKRTSLGLYLTAEEAHAALKTRSGVYLIDVRTRAETMFVGYPMAAAANIPFQVLDADYAFDVGKHRYRLVANPDFAPAVARFLARTGQGKGATLLLMCRSGKRSARAVNVLAKLGYENAYSVVDGFEGDADDNGKRTVNGWKNAGSPWTYKLSEAFRYRPLEN
ncbi:MAG: rhodanese-like domain-containing protein [Alphaproteobacteria bacterium]|nr:rhodanese-like domain-containing protein [Alphaproteobacteria bacterium]